MNYKRLGHTGLEVSPITLGCMTYGGPLRGGPPWTLDEEASRPFIKKAIELGINVFDTANVYSDGASEEITGRALRDFATRDEVVIATKVFFPTRIMPNGGGLSRRAIMSEIDKSLRRLGTDYIDLYQIHRWDPQTPIEETLEALHDLVKIGKVRYIGASSMHAWQFAKAIYTSRLHGWVEFVSMQNHMNLIYREEQREMLPFCVDQGIAVLPWSPLARGRLTRAPDATTDRKQTDALAKKFYDSTDEADQRVINKVAEIAENRGVPRAQVALAWLIQTPGVTSPIIGASKPHHLDDAIAALSLSLTPDEISALESFYQPRPVAGFS